MPTIDELFPSKYLKAADLNDEADTVLTIRSLEIEPVGPDKDDKPVLYFKGVEKGLVVNKTNFQAISDLYGRDSDDWPGHKVALYVAEVSFSGKTTLGVRVRVKPFKTAEQKLAAVVESEEAEY